MNQRSSVTVSAPTQRELRNNRTGNDVDFNKKKKLNWQQRCLKAATPRIIAFFSWFKPSIHPSIHQEAVLPAAPAPFSVPIIELFHWVMIITWRCRFNWINLLLSAVAFHTKLRGSITEWESSSITCAYKWCVSLTETAGWCVFELCCNTRVSFS